MLLKIGRLVKNHPWIVVGFVLLITIGFGSILPNLKMQTSMEHFLPDDEIVVAQEEINDYFGSASGVIMVLVKPENSYSVTSVKSLKELYSTGRILTEEFDEIIDVMSISLFVDNICDMEFGTKFENCTDEQIKQAFDDLMNEPIYEEIKMLDVDDSNENSDINFYPRLSKGKNIDSIDVKNYYIKQTNETFIFSIEVYELSGFENRIITPDKKLNVMEWFIDFSNLIIPYEELDISYKITAHIEPTNNFWVVGDGLIKNIKNIFNQIRNRGFFNSYKKESYLWISPYGMEVSLPIRLESAEINFNTENNRIEIVVNKTELGKYGLAPVFGGFGLPGRIGNTKAGFRYYQRPFLKQPWLRVVVSFDKLKNIVRIMQNRPIIGSISERLIKRFGDFSWSDINSMFEMLDLMEFEIDYVSLKDVESFWKTTDYSPDNSESNKTLFIKPPFFDGMKKNVLTFLSSEYEYGNEANATLMMINVNGSLSLEDLTLVSADIIERLEELDLEITTFSMGATGNAVIEYEINEVTMDANQIVIPLIFVVISIILFLSFFKLSYVFLPLLGLSLSIIWLFGTMVLLGMEFMIMEVALIPMLMGLGVDYSVHLFHDYRAELSKGKKPAAAIITSISDVGMALLLATITTFIAFLSFLSATIAPLRDFGVLCALGIAYVFIITITLQAAIRYILDRRKKVKTKLKPKRNTNSKIMRKIAKSVASHPKTIIAITIAVTILMAYGSMNIKTGFEMEDFLPEENPSVIVLNEVMDLFPFASQEREYILIKGEVATVKTLKGIRKTVDNLEDDKFVALNIDNEPKTTSVLSIFKNAAEQNDSLITKFNLDRDFIPSTDSEVVGFLDYMYNDESFNYEISEVIHKEGNNYDATVVQIYSDTFSDKSDDVSSVMEVLYNELVEDVEGLDHTDYIITGDNSMMHVIMNSMTESQILSTGVCILLAAIVLIIAYRKLTLGLITMIPVSISTVWIVGSMYFAGFSLNVMTIMITSLTIGLGITYAIHAVERFRLVADRTGDILSAVTETIGHTGGALLIAAITTIFGFGMLVLVPMPIEQQFGIITALTIFYALLTSLFILPPVLMYWGKWKKKKHGYIISPGKPKEIDEE